MALNEEQVRRIITEVGRHLDRSQQRFMDEQLYSLVRRLVEEQVRGLLDTWTGTIRDQLIRMINEGQLDVSITVKNSEAQNAVQSGTTQSN